MKKKVLAMLLATTMVATALTGCGSKSDSSSSSDDGKIKLTVWSPQEDQKGDNWLKTECEAFAEAHPEWDLTFEYGVCSEGDAKTNLGTDAEAGADVYMFANDQIADLIKANAIAPGSPGPSCRCA